MPGGGETAGRDLLGRDDGMIRKSVKRLSEKIMPRQVSAEDAKHDGADEGKRDIRSHDTQPADGHGNLPFHVTARI